MHKLQVTSVSLQSAVHKDYCVVLRSSIPPHHAYVATVLVHHQHVLYPLARS